MVAAPHWRSIEFLHSVRCIYPLSALRGTALLMPPGWAGAAQRDLDCSDWHQQSLLKEWFKSGGPSRLVPKLCIFSSLLCLQIQFSQHRRRLIIPWSLLTLVIVWKTSEIKKTLSKPLKKKKKKSAFLDYSFLQAPGTSLFPSLTACWGRWRVSALLGLFQLTSSLRPLWCTAGVQTSCHWVLEWVMLKMRSFWHDSAVLWRKRGIACMFLNSFWLGDNGESFGLGSETRSSKTGKCLPV